MSFARYDLSLLHTFLWKNILEKQTTLPPISAEHFWHWSGKIYSEEGVAQALLVWQNHFGGHVNGVLWLAYLDHQQRILGKEHFAAFDAVLNETFAQDVGPIRELRIKTNKNDANYAKYLQAELSAEQRQQKALVDLGLHIALPLDGSQADMLDDTFAYLHWHTERYVSDELKKAAYSHISSMIKLLKRSV